MRHTVFGAYTDSDGMGKFGVTQESEATTSASCNNSSSSDGMTKIWGPLESEATTSASCNNYTSAKTCSATHAAEKGICNAREPQRAGCTQNLNPHDTQTNMLCATTFF